MPCSARPTTISPSPSLSAQTTEPIANAPSEIARKRSLPNMSPSRPSTGVATDAARKYALIIQTISLVPTSKASCIAVSAGMTVVCASANASAPIARIASVTL